MGLREYRRKRDFSVTPEPRGARRAAAGRRFVVQKHAASRLHYDFRLEHDGVLKSWAVPKGPSLDPADKRLAMQTEDHPIEYGGFEGIIPEGEYGGGTVLLWDRGTWEPVGDPDEEFRKGSLKFRLDGEKLRGGWALVKIRGRDARDDAKSWLLIKEKDAEARPGSRGRVVESRPESVATGRGLEEIAGSADRVWHSNREASGRGGARSADRRPVRAAGDDPAPARRRRAARLDVAALAAAVPGSRRAPLPETIRPQLATLVTAAPPGDEWLHEIKFDGYRILARLDGGEVRLLSRNGHDWADRFPAIVAPLRRLAPMRAVLDGEVAVVRPDGTTSFQALQNVLNEGAVEGRLAYFLFDLLHLGGRDLTPAPLLERKTTLKKILDAGPDGAALRYSDHVEGSGPRFFEHACRLGVEGIVSKRRDAPYLPRRGGDWLKVKCHQQQEVVIGGFTEPSGSRRGFGALLLGVHEPGGGLVYVGKVGTGFSDALLDSLARRLKRLEQKDSPFAAARIPGVRKARWVRPELVAEVEFTEWTGDGRLRHPTFKGLREDKTAASVVREVPKPTATVLAKPAGDPPEDPPGAAAPVRTRAPGKHAAAVTIAGVRITHPDRVVYPALGLTKRDLAEFYVAIADWIVPQVRDRPLTLVRCPEGEGRPCFYMKHSGVWAPPALRRVRIREKTKVGDYLVVDDIGGVVALAQMSVLEIHTWNSTAGDLERPDRIVFDLDPDPSVGWDRVVAGALTIRRELESLGLRSFAKTSGSKGLHVVVPLRPGVPWDAALDFSRALAARIARREPGAYTTDIPKAARVGRILIDYLRNNRGSTTVAAYSTRARPQAPVSVPVAWSEVGPRLRPDQWTVRNLPARLARPGDDPWEEYGRIRQTLTAAMRGAVASA